jgi:hypothetical protein
MISPLAEIKTYEIFNSFVDPVDFTSLNSEFIKYTGFQFASIITQRSAQYGMYECPMYDVSCLEIININILFTAVNYMFNLFDCSGIIIKKYGDILETYTGDTWSKEFYKKIINISKVTRDIYEKNKNKSFKEIAEIVEKEIKMKPFLVF